MRFVLSESALQLLCRIKNNSPLSPEDWDSIATVDERAYLEAERSIVQERYQEIADEGLAGCSAAVREMVLTYRDLFLNPHEARRRAQGLLQTMGSEFGPDWQARFKFWLGDAHHIIGEIEDGQRVLGEALAEIDRTGIFRAEALTVTALSEYLAGENASASDYHYQARAELSRNPDLFLTIFNASMALRVFLKECDPVGFEVFSSELDQALSKKEDRRYLLRQTGYRAMLMTIVGDRDEAKRLWLRADALADQTSLAWERGQYGVLRGLVAALFDGTPAAGPYFDRAERELAEAGFPGPYRAELDCARVFSHWVGQSSGRGLKSLVRDLAAGQDYLRERAASAPAGLKAHYRQADLALDHLMVGNPSQPPRGPCLVVSLMTRLGRAEEMTRALSEFRLLPRFVRQLRRNSGSKQSIASALQSSIGLPVRLEGCALHVDSKLEAHESRPDMKLVMELADTLIRHHDLVTSTERSRVMGDLATQLAHDIRSPIAALKAAQFTLTGNQAELIGVAISRIQEITEDLMVAHRADDTAPTPSGGGASLASLSILEDLTKSLIQEKCLEFSGLSGIDIKYESAFNGDPSVSSAQVSFNRAHFCRAASNLINNAVEALNAQGRVCCRMGMDPSESEIEFSVTDSGPGFPQSLLEFDSEPLRSRRGGAALGIKQARDFARESAGRLILENSKDPSGGLSGARARMRLPLAKSMQPSRAFN